MSVITIRGDGGGGVNTYGTHTGSDLFNMCWICVSDSRTQTGGTTTVHRITTNTCGLQKVNNPDVVVSVCLHVRDKPTQTCHINLIVPRLNENERHLTETRSQKQSVQHSSVFSFTLKLISSKLRNTFQPHHSHLPHILSSTETRLILALIHTKLFTSSGLSV